MEIVTVTGVSKAFGTHSVLEDLNLAVPAHSIFGFIGQNGAGKTTTMKLILGLLRPDRGEIRVKGEQVKPGRNPAGRYMGYLPDVPEFYGFMTPMEYLSLCGSISGMSRTDCQNRAAMLLELVGLGREQKRIQGFSRGMKQRLGIAQALLGRPALLICDEPTSALDPVGRKEILDILRAAREETTVLFSTHILSDVERICDEIALLHHGKIALQGSLETVKRLHGNAGVEIEFQSSQDAERFAREHPECRREGPMRLLWEEEIVTVMRCLSRENLCVQRVENREPTLEDLFMEVTRE